MNPKILPVNSKCWPWLVVGVVTGVLAWIFLNDEEIEEDSAEESGKEDKEPEPT